MTTRFSGYLVVLDKDIREDDAEAHILAIRMIRGVIEVIPVEGDCGHSEHIAGSRTRKMLYEAMVGVLYPKEKP